MWADAFRRGVSGKLINNIPESRTKEQRILECPQNGANNNLVNV